MRLKNLLHITVNKLLQSWQLSTRPCFNIGVSVDKGELYMGMNVSNFYAINTIDKGNGKKGFYFHEYRNDNGKAAELVTTGDGFGDAKEAAESFIKQGFDPNKIKINGQLASDIFGKEDNKQTETKELKGFAKIKAKVSNFMQKAKNFFSKVPKMPVPVMANNLNNDNSAMLANQQHQMMMETINQQNFINQMNQDNMMHMQMMGMM